MQVKCAEESTMSNLAKKLVPVLSTDDPRRAFEKAIALIERGSPSRHLAQIPIGLHRQITKAEDPALEKRALSEAAQALARLWKISPSLVR
jgi:hypothetical protein